MTTRTTRTIASSSVWTTSIHRLLDEFGGIVDDRVIDAGREILLEPLHLLLDGFGRLQGVRAGTLKDAERRRNVVVEIGVERIILRAEFDARDIAQMNLAVGVGADDDVAELLRRAEPSQSLHRKLEGARRGRRRLIDRARGDLQIGAAQRGDDVARRQIARLDFRRIEPDAHRIVSRAKEARVADAVDSGDGVLHVKRRVV